MTFDPEKARKIAEAAQAYALSQGVECVRINLVVHQGVEARLREQKPERWHQYDDVNMRISLYSENRLSIATVDSLSATAIEQAIDAALAHQQWLAQDPLNAISDEIVFAEGEYSLIGHAPFDLQTDPQNIIATMQECESAMRDVDARVRAEAIVWQAENQWHWVSGSHQPAAWFSRNQYRLSASAIAEERGRMSNDYWSTVASDPARLLDARIVGERSAQQALLFVDTKVIDSRRAPVMFAPEAASAFIDQFGEAIQGERVRQQQSFLGESLQQQIFPTAMNVIDEPVRDHFHLATAFSREGVLGQRLPVVVNGQLQTFLCDNYAANALARAPTGHSDGLYSATVNPTQSLSDMMQSFDRGLLVYRALGQGVNLVNGNYSRGVKAVWYEDGEPRFSVDENTLAGNLLEMYQSIVAIGDDADARTRHHVGSMLFDELQIGGR